ncbi:PREDICTED: uncharacterized protein LOC105366685 [Ceratosolen solmsi marchali]|uniref:Uncharacterized protein LOC105366685 n=1 Tax=Ceratosolen solmsi marchali TaxID=326594 RepID=A0AAJ6YSL0_9HYME|nr:PREDICTED: uncharacterized protein LOC105366685 [Ceratosolen solmsi marchali]
MLMIGRLHALSFVILMFNIANESSSQFWRQFNGYPYPQRQGQNFNPNYESNHRGFQQQNGFESNFQLPPGVSMSQAEWVCKNPKTGDMMIVASEESSTPNIGNNAQNQWYLTNFSTVQPSTSSQVSLNPQNKTNFLQTEESIPNPDESYDTNGEGIIDIRLGDKKALNNETKQN